MVNRIGDASLFNYYSRWVKSIHPWTRARALVLVNRAGVLRVLLALSFFPLNGPHFSAQSQRGTEGGGLRSPKPLGFSRRNSLAEGKGWRVL